MNSFPARWRRYTAAVVLSGLAAGLAVLLGPVIDQSPVALIFAAVLLSAWYGGLGPGLASSLLGALVINALLVGPDFPSRWLAPESLFWLGAFALTSVLIHTLSYSRRPAEAEVRQRVAHLEALHDLSQVLIQAPSLEQVYAEALTRLQTALEAPRASILLFDPDGVMRFKAWHGLSDRYRQATEGHSPWTSDTPDPQPVLVADAAASPELAPLRPVILEEGIRALAFIPLVYQDRVLGKFMVYHDEPHHFEPAEVRLAQTIARQIAVAIERVRSQNLVRAERERLSITLASIADAVISTDAAGRVAYLNPAAESITGWSQAEAEGRPVAEIFRIVGEDARPIAENPAEKALREGVVVGLANHALLINREGREISIDDSGAPIRDAQGAIVGAVLIFRDIGERRRAEQRLANSEERYRSLVSATTAVVWTADAEGGFSAPQPAWQAYTGQDWEAHANLGWLKAFHPDDREAVQAGWSRALKKRALYEAGARLWHAASQEYRFTLARAAPIPNSDGGVREWIGTIADIHNHRLAELALESRTRQQAAIAALGQRALSEAGLEVLMAEVAQVVAQALGTDFSHVLQLAPDGKTLAVRAGVGWGADEPDRAAVEAGPGTFAGHILQAHTPVLFDNLQAEDRFESRPALLQDGVASGMAVAVRSEERPFGLIGVYTRQRRSFNPDEANFLLAGANVLAEAMVRRGVESALRVSHDQMAAILQNVAEGVTVQDASGRLIFANDVAARVLGFSSPEALLTASLQDLMQKFDLLDESGGPLPLAHLPGRRALLGEPNPAALVRFRIVATGEERWAHVKAKPIFDSQGAVQLAVNIFHDVTELKREELAQRILAEAGKLLSTSLDYQARLASLARLAVPRLADWCAVDILDEASGGLQRVAAAHVNPDRVALAEDLERRYPPAPDARYGPAHAVRTGQSELYPDIPDEVLAATARDAEHLQILRDLGMTSGMVVPLTARGRTIGAMTFVWAESGYRYSPEDLVLAEELARRTASAVDNARLYEDARRAEAALRESEGQLRSALQAGRMGTWVWDVRQGRLAWSEQTEIIHGLAQGTFPGTFEAFINLVHPQDRERLTQQIRQAMEQASDFYAEFRVIWPDGSLHWVNGQGQVVFDDAGQAVQMVGVGADITARKQIETEVREQNESLETLNEVGQALAAELNLEKLVQAVTDAATRLSGAQFGAFFFNNVDEQGESYMLYTLSGASREDFATFPMPRKTQVFGPTFRGEEVVRTHDIRKDPRYGHNPPYQGLPAGHLPITSYMAVPVISRSGEVMGGLFLGHAEPGVFGEREERLVVGLAAQTAVAMDNARLFEAESLSRRAAERAAHRTARLQEVTAALSVALTPAQVADVIVQQSVSALGARAGLVRVSPPDAPGIATVQAAGYPESFLAAFNRIAAGGEVPADDVVQTGEPIWLESQAAFGERYPALGQVREPYGYEAFAGVPLKFENKTLGALGLSFGETRSFDQDDRLLLLALAAQCAQALERARLYEAEQRARQGAEIAAERTAQLQSITAALSRSLIPKEVTAVCVARGVAALHARGGAVVLRRPERAGLDVIQSLGFSPDELQRWQEPAKDAPSPVVDSIKTGAPVWLETRGEWLARYPGCLESAWPGSEGALALAPLLIEGRAIGALGLRFAGYGPLAEADRAFITALAQQCAQALERARLYEAEQQARAEAEQARQRLALLSEASVALASSLDYHVTLQRLARLMLPYMADYCVVYVLEAGGQLRAVANAHSDLRKEGLLRELDRLYRPAVDAATTEVGAAMHAGRARLLPAGLRDEIEVWPRDKAIRKLVSQLDPRSAIVAPLIARDRPLGAILLVYAESDRRRYSSEDLTLAEELARRAALAVDIALLYAEAQTLNTELEQRVAERTEELQAASEELELANVELEAEVAERLQVEDKIRQSEQRLTEAQQIARLGNWHWDIVRNTITWSDELYRIYGRSPETFEVSYESFLAAVHPEDREQVHAAVSQALQDFRPFVFDHRIICPDGTVRSMQARGHVSLDARGQPVAMDGTGQDISDQKRIEEELRASREQLRQLSSHLQAAREEERTRISREIHDELGGALTGIKMDASRLGKLVDEARLDALHDRTAALSQAIDATIRLVRRIATDLRPGVLDDFGLVAAIEWQLQDFEARSGIACELRSSVEDINLDPDSATAIFRVFQETLTNVARHAQAAHVRVTIEKHSDYLVLQVQDDGRGISPAELSNVRSLGLVGMRERVHLLSGMLDIRGVPGSGTTVLVKIPLNRVSPAAQQLGAMQV